jgi:selenocysteine lyase/cysteine desulfurase
MPTQSIFLTGTMIGNQKQKRRILILSNEHKKNVVEWSKNTTKKNYQLSFSKATFFSSVYKER